MLFKLKAKKGFEEAWHTEGLEEYFQHRGKEILPGTLCLIGKLAALCHTGKELQLEATSTGSMFCKNIKITKSCEGDIRMTESGERSI